LLDSEEVVKSKSDSVDCSSPNISNLRNDVSVPTKGRNVTGKRCCSSNVNRGLRGEEEHSVDVVCMLRGDADAEGVVVCKGGVMLPSFVSFPADGRLDGF
jgi:hypothetical protein